ncbi:esterase/lipase family protein [Merismopedia glauca]|uniref:Lipase n=1 Tax=Merismopedia glauca CCAP 1448/3 TaxID=1296344 RepID=A0A2T1C865_9CYAN|nr:alpha/beta fold hydrolase [Merismopedia glauca]PSB04482.1 lipase [Merismopedia glauca CCAP 1448/3]
METYNSDRHPVLLIPGLNDTARIFRQMSTHLQYSGWEVHIVEVFPSNGKLGIDKLAIQVDNYVKSHFSPTQALDLVGLSMGGIIGRYYIQKMGGIERIKRYISLASPHQGTIIAYFSQTPAAIQMRPNSALLTELNQDSTWLAKLDVTSIWTPWDLMIVPAYSSRLPVTQEEVLHVSFHGLVARNKAVIAAVIKSLSQKLGASDRNIAIE